MSTTAPRHSTRPAQPTRRRTWPWVTALVLLLCATGYLWSHVITGA